MRVRDLCGGTAALLLLAPALSPCATAAAQAALPVGQVVRVRPHPRDAWRVGRLRAVAGDTLWLTPLGVPSAPPGRPVLAPPGQAALEVGVDYDAISQRRHRIVGLLALGGLVAGIAQRGGYTVLASGGVGAAAGAAGGIVVASLLYPRAWEPVRR